MPDPAVAGAGGEVGEPSRDGPGEYGTGLRPEGRQAGRQGSVLKEEREREGEGEREREEQSKRAKEAGQD